MNPWRRRLGPALHSGAFPLFGMTVSAIGHATLFAALLLAAWSQWNASKVYVVNLVPAVSQFGSPAGRSVAPSLPPRPEPRRSAAEPTTKEAPAPPKAPVPSLPEARASRTPSLPRAGEKELPPLAASSERRPSAASASPRTESPDPATEARAAVAPVPLGRPSGSPAGVASLSLDVSDFPFTYYLRQIQQKVSEKWVHPARTAERGLRVLVLFEISRDGQIATPEVEKSSGNVWYDQSALRAVMDAAPFPPLPQEFQAESLRVHFGFDFERGRS